MKTNYSAILRWNNTIAKWRATDDIHIILDAAGRIKDLEKRIAFPMGIIIKGLNDLAKKYFELDEKGQVKYDSEAQDAKPIMNGDLTRQGYEEEKAKFLSTEIDIRL